MAMDHEHLVRLASGGDVEAFVDLTRRFQHFAYGSALALARDFQQAEDVVQEAFLAAWSGLPGLADPAAFPGWLRGIVRHQAFRILRPRQLRTASLAEAEEVPSAEPYTRRPGATVTAAEALRTCREILDGHYDDLPVDAFFFSGGIGEISGNIERVLPFGPVTI
jgi:DNA-directed RNA polymerase specialized sigma24 family protein